MADLSYEEAVKLVEAFNKLKVKPKADTPEDLELWLKEYGKGDTAKADPKVDVKKEPSPDDKTKTTISSTVHQPRISIFFGDTGKGEVSYAQWVYEVKCLMLEKVHKQEVIKQAIRNSLRGEAANLLRRLGYGATIPDILDKFESVYGETDSKEHLLSKFYSSKQEEHETVTKWSCRLEDILATAVERKLVQADQVDEMLRNMFYQGLKPTLKDICAYKFEQIKDFDKLRVAIRKIEQDHLNPEALNVHCHSSVDQNKPNKKEEKSEMKEMKSMIQSLTNTVQQLENKFNAAQTFQGQGNQGFQGHSSQGFNQQRGRGKYRPNYDQNYNKSRNTRPRSGNRGQNYSNQGQGQSQGQRFQYQGQRFNNPNQYNQNQSYEGQNVNNSNQAQATNQTYEENFNRGPLCFRCKQYGHYQWECGVRMDHSRSQLN